MCLRILKRRPKNVTVYPPVVGATAEALPVTASIEERVDRLTQIAANTEKIAADTQKIVGNTGRSIWWTQVGIILAIIVSIACFVASILLQFYNII